MNTPDQAVFQAVPEPGKEYPVVLGETLLQAHANKRARHSLCCVRYTSSRPRQGTSEQPGKLLIKPDQQVVMQLPNSTVGEFEGPIEEVQHDSSGYDCVAVFDGTCFRLELVSSTIHARHTRATTDLGDVPDDPLPSPLRMALTEYYPEPAGQAQVGPPAASPVPASDGSSGGSSEDDDGDDDDDESDGGAASPPMQRVDTAWNLDGVMASSSMDDGSTPARGGHGGGALHAHVAGTPPALRVDDANTPPRGITVMARTPPAATHLSPLAMPHVPRALLQEALAARPELQPADDDDDTEIETDSSSADDDDAEEDVEQL